MITTKLTVSGVEFFDYKTLQLSRSISDNNTVSTYSAYYDSPYGRHKNDFIVGQEVKIYADQNTTPATTNIFTGIIDTVNFQGEGLSEAVEIRGRDYSARLLDNTVQPIVYTNTEVGSIVRNIITNNLTDIGSANIQTTSPLVVLPRIGFNQVPIFDAVKQLAEIAGYTFYVDNDKDLHFEPLGSQTANLTIDSGNTIRTTFDKTREGMANKIWVYGDRYLSAAPTEKFNVGSPNVGGLGSVFTVTYNPFNSSVSVLGSVRIGGVYNLNATLTSGTAYLVSFDDKQIIFPSGTEYGYYLPPSGGSIVVNYDRQVPIVKYGEDSVSIQAYGAKTIVINDKSIKDPNTAITILETKLAETNPLNNIEAELKGWYTFSPGQTVNISIPDFNLVLSGLPVIEMQYDFNPYSVMSEEVLSVKLDNREINITDKIKDLSKKIGDIEAQDRQSADVYTRLQYSTGSVQIIGSAWNIKQQLINNSFMGTHPYNGRLGKIGSNFFYWEFDQSGTWISDLINDVSGVLVGATDLGSGFYATGSTIQLGSNQYYRFGGNGSFFSESAGGWLNGSQLLAVSGAAQNFGWSINSWIYNIGSDLIASGNIQPIVGTRFGDNTVFYISGESGLGQTHYSIGYRTDDGEINSPGSYLMLNTWNNVGVSWKLHSRSGDTGSPFYPYFEYNINGSMVFAGSYRYATGNPFIAIAGGSYYIGWESRSGFNFNGKIENVYIYTRFLSGIEHAQFYTGTGSSVQPLLSDRRNRLSVLTSGGYY